MKRIACAIAAAAFILAGAPAARAETQTQVIADASAESFALRPSYDSGGANPLNLFVGYSDASLGDVVQGQASWYNFNIAETAAFDDPQNCLPYRDPHDSAKDVQTYLSDTVGSTVSAIAAGNSPPPPLVPSITGMCTERFPGFAQSLFPSTDVYDEDGHLVAGIPESSKDNYLDKPTAAASCRDEHAQPDPNSAQCRQYKASWSPFSTAVRGFVQDGAFSAAASPTSQHSIAVLFGIGDGKTVSIGLSITRSDAVLSGQTLTVTSSAELYDVCIGAAAGGTCALAIDKITQEATVVKTPKTSTPRNMTTILGVHGSGIDKNISATDLFLNQAQLAVAPYFGISAVSASGDCGAGDAQTAVADAGGFRIYGSGGPGKQGGSIMIGGACARARLDLATIDIPRFVPDLGYKGVPPSSLTIPGSPGAGTPGRALYGPPQVVTHDVTRYVFARAIAWRTAPYWASTLIALALLTLAAYMFRRTQYVAPAVRALDRFARQFVRG
ncbi:MAG: hypothetical protein ABR552_02320 [Actinomycetota bacterium]|nr:hypothetical protein [Actinomycetota bacterium]